MNERMDETKNNMLDEQNPPQHHTIGNMFTAREIFFFRNSYLSIKHIHQIYASVYRKCPKHKNEHGKRIYTLWYIASGPEKNQNSENQNQVQKNQNENGKKNTHTKTK